MPSVFTRTDFQNVDKNIFTDCGQECSCLYSFKYGNSYDHQYFKCVYYMSIDSNTTHISTISLPGAHGRTHSKIYIYCKITFHRKSVGTWKRMEALISACLDKGVWCSMRKLRIRSKWTARKILHRCYWKSKVYLHRKKNICI